MKQWTTSLKEPPGDGSKSFSDIRSAASPSDTTFAAADSRGRVVIVHVDGRIVRAVGQVGAGPGEYRVPMLLTAIGDAFALWDATLRRVSWFDSAGEFQRAQPRSHAQSTMPVAPNGTAFLTVRESGQLADTTKAAAALMRIGADPEVGHIWEVRDVCRGRSRVVIVPVGVELLDVRGKWIVGVAEVELGGQQIQVFAIDR